MLIVNADDWGRSKEATDNALVCYEHRRISSATAMVFMADSLRGAEVALNCGIDVGLHLNFTEDFNSPFVPQAVRQAHRKVSHFLRLNKYALILYHPFLRKQFELLFRAQLNEFERLYKKLPSHIDGHQHMHLCSNMLIDRIIPAGTRIRKSFSFNAGQKDVLQRAYRNLVNNFIASRYKVTDYFFALVHHLSREKMVSMATLAKDHSVEVMAHPELAIDYQALMADEYTAITSGVELTGYSSL